MAKLNLSYNILIFPNKDCNNSFFEIENPDPSQAEKIIDWLKRRDSLNLKINSIRKDEQSMILYFDSADFPLEGATFSLQMPQKDFRSFLKKGEHIPIKYCDLKYLDDSGEVVAHYKKEFQINLPATFPSETQVDLYNKFLPAGFPPIEGHEFVVYSLRIADNLINRRLGRWTEPDLLEMSYRLPGTPVTSDHDWNDINKIHSIIINSKLQYIDGNEALNLPWLRSKMNTRNLFNENEKIVKKEGYISVLADAAIPSIYSATIQKIGYGLLNSVSLGGFEFTDIGCPLCNASFFDRKKCSHQIPTDENLGEENVAPYYNRLNLIDLGEVSFVLIPNLPAAGIIQKWSIN